MKKIKATLTLILASASVLLTGCEKHVHIYEFISDDSQFHHATCTLCGASLPKEEHTINDLTNGCTSCSYVDPIINLNEEHVVTGLTNYGKTKYIIELPEAAEYLGAKSFYDSEVRTLYLTKKLKAYHKDAFSGIETPNLITEEDYVEWVPYGDYIMKKDILGENEAYVDGKVYPTLKEAISSVQDNNVTITLLKENLVINDPIDINYNITIDSYHTSSTLKATFNISSSGVLIVSKDVILQGTTNLLTAEYSEWGNIVLTSGSLLFQGLESEPSDIAVKYIIGSNTYSAAGASQVINDLIVVPQTYYMYGAFKFNKDRSILVGFTKMGSYIKKLTISSVIDGKTMSIGERAFTYKGKATLMSLLKIEIVLWFSKGSYNEVYIADGISNIGKEAFSNHIDSNINYEMKLKLAPLVSHLKKVTIGDSVERIENGAFSGCLSLETFIGGENLNTICSNAFYENYAISNVDLSKSLKLTRIESNAFGNSPELANIILPTKHGWKIGGYGYLESDLTSQAVANFMKMKYSKETWTRNINAQFLTYNPNSKDSEGRYNKVFYYDNLQLAIDNSEDGNIVTPVVEFDNQKEQTMTVTKQITLKSNSRNDTIKISSIAIYVGKYAIIDAPITISSYISLHYKSDGNNVKDLGGIAFNKSLNKDLKISECKINGYATSKLYDTRINNIDYTASGLLNFWYNQDKSEKELQIISASPLGRLAQILTIGNPIGNEKSVSYTTANAHSLEKLSELKEVRMDDTMEKIYDSAFDECTSLEKVTFGKNFKVLDKYVFNKCSNLNNVIFSSENSSLEKIGHHSFNKCSSLSSFALPIKSCPLNYIGAYAFDETKLTSFDFAGNKSNWKADGKEISSSDIENKTSAAKIFTETHKGHDLTR